MMCRTRWGAARVGFVLAGALVLFIIACSSGDQPQQEQEAASPAQSMGPAGQLIKAGLWAAPGSGVGTSMRVEPGDNPDLDPWYFYLGSAEVECLPKASPTHWQFSGCEIVAYSLLGFEAVVPKRPNPPLQAILAYENGRTRDINLEYVAELSEPVSEGVDLVWHRYSNSECQDNTGIWADRGLVFAPCGSGIVEILDAVTGKLVGIANANAGPGAGRSAVLEVAARGGLLFAATTRHGVLIWDVSDPAHPRHIGQFLQDRGQGSPQSVYNVHTLTLSPKGNLLFVVNQSHSRSDVRVIDVSDPAQPREVGRYLPQNTGGLGGGAHDLALEERDGRLIAYFNQLGGGFHILDVTNPATIVEVSQATWPNIFSHSAWPFAVGGRRYVAHTDEGYDRGLSIMDVTDLAHPRVVSRYQSRPGTSIHNVRVEGGIAFLSYYIDGLRVVNLRDPERPREIAHYDTVPSGEEVSILDGAWGVHVDNGIVYVSDRSSGVYAFEVRLP